MPSEYNRLVGAYGSENAMVRGVRNVPEWRSLYCLFLQRMLEGPASLKGLREMRDSLMTPAHVAELRKDNALWPRDYGDANVDDVDFQLERMDDVLRETVENHQAQIDVACANAEIAALCDGWAEKRLTVVTFPQSISRTRRSEIVLQTGAHFTISCNARGCY